MGREKIKFLALALREIQELDTFNNSWGVFKNQLYLDISFPGTWQRKDDWPLAGIAL
jgi:hypothetical protein